MNVLDGQLRRDAAGAWVDAHGLRWPLTGETAGEDGQTVKYGIRPEHVDLDRGEISAEVIVVEPMGAATEVLVKVGEATLNLMTHGRCSARPGERIAIAPQPRLAHLFDAATGQRL